jgi:hypothetical protein
MCLYQHFLEKIFDVCIIRYPRVQESSQACAVFLPDILQIHLPTSGHRVQLVIAAEQVMANRDDVMERAGGGEEDHDKGKRENDGPVMLFQYRVESRHFSPPSPKPRPDSGAAQFGISTRPLSWRRCLGSRSC